MSAGAVALGLVEKLHDQVLEVMVAAREPLSRKQIAAVTGLDAEKELLHHT